MGFSLVVGPMYHPMKWGSYCSEVDTAVDWPRTPLDPRMPLRSISHAERGANEGKVIDSPSTKSGLFCSFRTDRLGWQYGFLVRRDGKKYLAVRSCDLFIESAISCQFWGRASIFIGGEGCLAITKILTLRYVGMACAAKKKKGGGNWEDCYYEFVLGAYTKKAFIKTHQRCSHIYKSTLNLRCSVFQTTHLKCKLAACRLTRRSGLSMLFPFR